MPPLYVITRPEDHPGTSVLVLQLGDGRLPLRKGESSEPRRLSEWDIKEVRKLRGFKLETEGEFTARLPPDSDTAKRQAMPDDLLGAAILTLGTAIRETEPGEERGKLEAEHAALMAELRRREALRKAGTATDDQKKDATPGTDMGESGGVSEKKEIGKAVSGQESTPVAPVSPTSNSIPDFLASRAGTKEKP